MLSVDEVQSRFEAALPSGVGVGSLRYVWSCDRVFSVRRGTPEPLRVAMDQGWMATVVEGRGEGYGATCDLSVSGLRRAFAQARRAAALAQRYPLVDRGRLGGGDLEGRYESPVVRPWSDLGVGGMYERLQAACAKLRTSDRIVDWEASVQISEMRTVLVTTSGGRIEQTFHSLMPYLRATAHQKSESQTRTLGGIGYVRQGGLEILDAIGFDHGGEVVAREAEELLAAEACPTETMDLVLFPDQMVLQVHESIGHPLELDRILGDERNYAGTSFVKLEDFGVFRYGSDLLNVTFDPSVVGERASYAFDDDGTPAEREYLIRRGILERPLGGRLSQLRAGTAGTANSRACHWNRPPIDRMANLNVEAGSSTLSSLVASVDRGVMMKTNSSWSIDDSRNKFQFGCEWAQMIEGGKPTRVVKTPNYRGISREFWRSLAAVGDESTFEVMGAPFCGKGEPQQAVFVGHGTPVCLFKGVQVFGGST